MRHLIIVVLLLVAPFATVAQTAPQTPVLRMRDIQGRPFRLSDYTGKVVLINFWATWCPPCRTEIPELIKMQKDYRSLGLQVVGITYPPQKLFEVRRFVRKARVNYPTILGDKRTKLLFTASETLPMTVVIDRRGNVHDVIEGILLPEEFQEKIRPLLADGPSRLLLTRRLMRKEN